VINAATSYNALIGRPWLHENGVVPSINASNIKDPLGDIVRFFVDKKPFIIVESFYADAKSYFKPMDKVSKPKSTLALEQSIPSIEDGESSPS
jgi:hypothetical protein